MKKIILAAAVLAATSAPALAAPGDTDTGQGVATATVIAPISINHTAGASLAFGSFTTGAGSVVVTPAGAGSVTGDVAFVTGSSNSADSFAVTGDPGRSFTITTAAGTVSNGTATISFTTTPSAPSATLDAAGTRNFTVGGTLSLSGTEAAGAYTGTYDATVAYN